MAERTIFTLAAHVARQLTKARIASETYRCGDTDLAGWLLWSSQWQVEHHRPGKNSISDPSKFSMTSMVVLGTDGTLYHLEPEKRWDSGVLHYPTTHRVREAAWHWLDSYKKPLTSIADIDYMWDYWASKPKWEETQKQPHCVTKFYPPKIAPYKSGEEMMRKLLYRRLNRIDREAKDGAPPSRGGTGAAPSRGELPPSAAAPTRESPPPAAGAPSTSPGQHDRVGALARVAGIFRRR